MRPSWWQSKVLNLISNLNGLWPSLLNCLLFFSQCKVWVRMRSSFRVVSGEQGCMLNLKVPPCESSFNLPTSGALHTIWTFYFKLFCHQPWRSSHAWSRIVIINVGNEFDLCWPVRINFFSCSHSADNSFSSFNTLQSGRRSVDGQNNVWMFFWLSFGGRI